MTALRHLLGGVFVVSALTGAGSCLAETPAAVIDRIIDGERLIVGTVVDDPRKYPFQVALIGASAAAGEEASRHFCGGTLIADKWVLTAAHCAAVGREPRRLARFVVYAGSLNFSNGERIPLQRSIIHPNYDPGTMAFDFALLELVRAPIVAKPIALGQEGAADPPSGSRVLTLGWGATETSAKSEVLRETSLRLVSQEECKSKLTEIREEKAARLLRDGTARIANDSSTFSNKVKDLVRQEPVLLTDAMICAGAPPSDDGSAKRVADTCHGDSGGPLLRIAPDGSSQQVGIVSWGDGCGIPGRFAVFARVSAVAGWIQEHISRAP